MIRGTIKKISVVLLACMVMFSIFSEISFAREDTAVSNGQIGAEDQTLTQEKPKITYGPYHGTSSEQKHAYEPFKDKESTKAAEEKQQRQNYKSNSLLIKMKDTASGTEGSTYGTFGAQFSDEGVLEMEPLFTDNGKHAGQLYVMEADSSKQTGGTWYKATLKEGADVMEAAEMISKEPGVVMAEPDYIRNTSELELPDITTDEGYGQQWYLEKLGIKQAWNYLGQEGIEPGGSRDIVVAVIDTGVDYNHPDLEANMWINTGEIPDNGIDDDNNGFIDDIHGASTVGNRYAGESGDPMDDHGHGTHVAGIIASQAKNGVGGAGIAYNVQIMAIKAAQSSGSLSASDIAQAINYAVDKGADIINMSFGGYGRSVVEEDALQTAFGTSVLIAAAGNDGTPNESVAGWIGAPMYPAAYNWVLGVMAEEPAAKSNGDYLASFSNWDVTPENASEYELMAPGVDIFSTLPDGRYAKWSGTSMAAPVVSGIAALVRSKFSNKSLYSSRFIMGQLACAGEMKQGITYSPNKPPINYYEVNAYQALTNTPKPSLSYMEHYLFDTTDINDANDGDGVADAGETINIGMVIRNQWGKAEDVQVTIDTKSSAGIDDPYVTVINDTVNYGAVGNFAVDDNGLLWDEEGAVTGVNLPFTIKLAQNTPNDHIIPINVTITAKNGFDAGDNNTYTAESGFSIMVRRGRGLPSIISQDMTLTKDDYWLLPNNVLIEEGTTVTVEPGTQIQFWSADPSDPYAEQQMPYLQVEGKFLVNGTAEEPVEIFAGALYPGYEVRIYSTGIMEYTGYINSSLNGYAELNYAKVMNPRLAVNKIDHTYFSQDLYDRIINRYSSEGKIQTIAYYGPVVKADRISNSYFYQLGTNYGNSDAVSDYQRLRIEGEAVGNLFDSCVYLMNSKNTENNVYLKNYKVSTDYSGNEIYWASKGNQFAYGINPEKTVRMVYPEQYNGKTYCIISVKDIEGTYRQRFQFAEFFANQLGGHIVSINDSGENEFLKNYFNSKRNEALFKQTYPGLEISSFGYFNQATLGLNDLTQEGTMVWTSGEVLAYTNWGDGEPDNKEGSENDADYVIMDYDGKWQTYSRFYYPFILELPGSYTQEQLDAARNEMLEDGTFSTVKNNALLNNWKDPHVEHWMRFFSVQDRDVNTYLSNNYWGTTSKTILDKAMVDYSDDFNTGKIIYEPILTQPPESAYPFVTDIYLSTQEQDRAERVGAETAVVNVCFNRDMDMSVQPQVSFGPDMPYTDYMVDGDWQTARLWTGSIDINPLTGDGYQYFRVAGAAADDDPWLITGNDSERFGFEILTSGSEAMNLQAEGAEGKIILSWTQDDFDLLAGYNLYRSETQNGSYTRVNTSLITADQKTFEDTEVEPGKVYYYKFTVVKTDFSESDYSNIALAAALDTVQPAIGHQPATEAAVGLPLQIYADVTDNVEVQSADFYYRKIGTETYEKRAMVKTTDNRYSVTLEGTLVQAPGIEYYIEVTDGVSVIRDGSADMPHKIVILDAPHITSITPKEGAESGGISVIITGTNFKEGASVLFDTAPASDVHVESATRMTAVSPAHYPAVVDVTVTNSDQNKYTLLQAFTYRSGSADVSIPKVNANRGSIVRVPVSISNITGLRSVDMTLTYDADLLQFQDVSLGSITNKFTLAENTLTPGQVKLSMASSMAVSGEGTLVNIDFKVLDTSKTMSALALENIQLNAGNIPANKADGSFNLSDTYSIDGRVYYYKDGKAVGGVNLQLNGDHSCTSITDYSGSYLMNSVVEGTYVLTAEKEDEAVGITSYDASLILQSSAGLLALDANQQIAADVDHNGQVNAMDASYVLEKAADLRQLPFPGRGRVWAFVPEQRECNVNADYHNQDFTAILIGDVTGNWSDDETAIQNISSLKIELGDVEIQQDADFTVPLNVNMGEEKLYALDLTLAYDADALQVLDVKKAAANDFVMAVNTNTPGVIKVALAGVQAITDSQKMLDLSFRPIGNVGQTTITIQNADFNEKAFEVKEDSEVGSSDTSIVYGDLNEDERVTAGDATLVLRAVVGLTALTDAQQIAADVNGDGRITAGDATLILRKVVGLIELFPVQMQ
ncbi:S8 family serine peptidase [Petroclostridium sp. X23]|uniref:S8 family serine peptidase n=1 Tax=Petroclostridium sp. X23 TaxID=3045146 RepID=UPI0024AD208F|nr:S8 family serine peptidase [Petroclostridium sp. X23]WHH57906.1 S8 family serine peptidase [Petroclostridium sp. X23]